MNRIHFELKGLIAAVLFCLFAYSAGFWLLWQSYLSGSEFVTLVIAGTVTGLVIAFAPFIKEVSIAGNIIKLREAKADADKALEGLKHARVSMLVATLSSLRRSALSLEDQLLRKDDRIGQFLSLYETNQDLLKNTDVADEFRYGASLFLQECINKIHAYYPKVSNTLEVIKTPKSLENWYRDNMQSHTDSEQLPSVLVEYRKLNEILDSLKDADRVGL